MNNEFNSLQKDISQQFITMLEDWIPANSSIAIAVQNSYIYFHPGNYGIHFELGRQVEPGSIAQLVMHTKKRTDPILDNTLFGTPIYGIGYPIHIQETPAALVVVLPSTATTQKLEPYQFLTGKRDEEWTPVAIDQISYIESLQKRTWFYVEKDQFKTSITLKELQMRLPPFFIRIHRSYIVNIHFIKKMARDLTSNFIVTLKDGTELPVSQSYLNHLRSALEF